MTHTKPRRGLYRKATPEELGRAARAVLDKAQALGDTLVDQPWALPKPADPYDARVVERATGKVLPMPKKPPKITKVEVDATGTRMTLTMAKRGRPATGQTPAKERKAYSRAKLAALGGKEVTVSLNPQAAAALEHIRTSEGLGTDTAAIEDALIHRANLLHRRAKLTGGKP